MTTWGLLAFARFESPVYLWLLLLLPLVVVLSLRSLAGLGPVRRTIAIVLRCAVVAALVLALAGLQSVRTNDDLSVVFLIDRSNSVPGRLQNDAFEFVAAAERDPTKRNEDALSIVGFDGRATIEQLPAGGVLIPAIGDPLAPDETNIAAALRLAMAVFPGDTMRRIVLLSDGNENAGEVLAEAEQLAAADVPVDIVPLLYEHRDEVIVEQVQTPASAEVDETIDVRVVLRSNASEPVAGQLKLYQNGNPVDLGSGGDGYPLTVRPGPSAYRIPTPLRVGRVYRFDAVFEPNDATRDTISANNVGRSFTVVSGQGRVLLVTTETNLRSARLLQAALEREKLVVDVQQAGETPLTQENLLDYSLVILDNVPSNLVPESQQQALRLYVSELGGGLMMLGGDESFGAGGWIDSPVEEVMPIAFDVKAKKQIPKGALVLLMHACEIPQGNYIGERVAIETVKTLSSRDLVGILAYNWRGVGDDWVYPLGPVGGKTQIIQRIRKMSMGDLQDLYPTMKAGVDALVLRKDAAAKHMIITSDFDPQLNLAPGANGARLLQTMRDAGISCSTVSIGWGGHPINATLANAIASGAAPGGKHYAVKDFSKLPQIFIKEAQIVRRSLINEEPFTPEVTTSLSPALTSLLTTRPPQLGGYVVATAKPLAEVPLVRTTEDGPDPILAHWQAKAGKTVAFTSGMWDRWGEQWAGWERFGPVFAQLARWASRPAEASEFDVRTEHRGGRGILEIDALDKNADAINFMDLNVTLLTPEGQSVPVRVTPIAPGRYRGEFDARGAGSYILNVGYQVGAGDNTRSGSFRHGLSVPYSPEYRELAANAPLLEEVRRVTTGRQFDIGQTSSIFDRAGLPLAEAVRPIWENLLQWMLLLFLLDVAVRRIAFDPAAIARKVRQRIAELSGGRSRAAETAAVLTALKDTRERLQETRRSETGPAPTHGARYEAPIPDAKVSEDLSKALGGTSEVDQPVVARPTRKQAPTDQGSYTSRLLAAKKRAQQQRQEPDEGGEKPDA